MHDFIVPSLIIYAVALAIATIAGSLIFLSLRRNWRYLKPQYQNGHSNIVVWMVTTTLQIAILACFAAAPFFGAFAHLLHGETAFRTAIGVVYGLGILLILVDCCFKRHTNIRTDLYRRPDCYFAFNEYDRKESRSSKRRLAQRA